MSLAAIYLRLLHRKHNHTFDDTLMPVNVLDTILHLVIPPYDKLANNFVPLDPLVTRDLIVT